MPALVCHTFSAAMFWPRVPLASQALGHVFDPTTQRETEALGKFHRRESPGPCCHPCPQPGAPQGRAVLLADLPHCVPRFNQPLAAKPWGPVHIQSPALLAASLISLGMHQRVLGYSSQHQGWGYFHPNAPPVPWASSCDHTERKNRHGKLNGGFFAVVQNLAKSHTDVESFWPHRASAWVL